ncbi:response regulator [Arenibacter palladensis]|uniref:response regulator n=1 Tax=Arenibacter palladensis TaxID=237373 RepID=UPI002FD4F50B
MTSISHIGQRFIGLVVFLCLHTVCSAQSPNKIDSLKRIISTNINDSLKIRAYTNMFPVWISNDLDSSRYYSTKGYSLAKQTKNSKGIADLSVYTAYVDIRRGSYAQAHQILDEALELLNKLNNYKPGQFHVLNWKAYAYRHESKLDSAKIMLTEIIDASASSYPQNTISAYFTLGQIANSEHKFHEAISYYQNADSLCLHYNKTMDNPTCASILANIGMIFKAPLSQYNKALDYLGKARSLYLQRRDQILVYGVDIEMAEIYYEQQEYEKAKNLLKTAVQFYKEQGIVKDQLKAMAVLNKVYLATHDYVLADQYLQNTYDLSIKIQDTFNLATTLVGMGILDTGLKRYERAEQRLNKALEYSQLVDDEDLKGWVYEELANLYLATEDYGKAYWAREGNFKWQLEKERAINQSKVSELESRYQSDKKEQEIALLTSDNKLAEQQKSSQKITFMAISGILLLGLISIYILYRNKGKVAKKLKELDGMKSRFFSNISHEFRTPLTLISGPVEHQLSKEHLQEDDKLELTLIQRNAKRMMALIDQLLELSRLDAGGQALEIGHYDLHFFMNQLVEPFRYRAQQQKLGFKSQYTGEYMAWFDKEVLYKVISNLLGNAIKYTDPQGEIAIGVYRKDERVEITVENTCSRFNDADLPQLFTRFYQSDNHMSGVGIGLSLVKELVQFHKGNIGVEKRNGDRICFSLYLPGKRTAYSASELKSIDPEATQYAYTTGIKEGTFETEDEEMQNDDQPVLLVVDDNTDICLFVQNLFKHRFKVLSADNGLMGVKKAQETIPDIILSDIMMPDKDGLYLVNTLKNDERTSHIPIILLTAKSGSSNEIQGLKTGADAYVVKPFETEKLKVQVNNMLHNRRLLQQHYQDTGMFNGMLQKESISQKDRFIEHLQEVLSEHLTDPTFNAESFSRAMHMSRMQLHRKIKALTAGSTSEFLRSERLKLAKQMLYTPGITVAEVAYRSGFNQPAYFTTCFKEKYGISPSQYVGQGNTSDTTHMAD